MNDEKIVEELSKMICNKCELFNNYGFNDETKIKINDFLKTSISIKMKMEILSLLYQLAIYSEAEVLNNSILDEGLLVLSSQNNHDAIEKIGLLELALKTYRDKEINPIETVIEKLERY